MVRNVNSKPLTIQNRLAFPLHFVNLLRRFASNASLLLIARKIKNVTLLLPALPDALAMKTATLTIFVQKVFASKRLAPAVHSAPQTNFATQQLNPAVSKMVSPALLTLSA